MWLQRIRRHARYDLKCNRNLTYVCHEIARILSALELPAIVREVASVLFQETQAITLMRSRSIETIAAGSVYGACREVGVVRSIEAIATVATGNRAKMLLGHRVLNRKPGLATPPLATGKIFPRVSGTLDASRNVKRPAVELAAAAYDQMVGNGCAPSRLAAACLYQASQEHEEPLTQATVADAADVTPATLRAHW